MRLLYCISLHSPPTLSRTQPPYGIEYVSRQGEKVKLATESYREIELRHAAVESWEIIIQKIVEMSSRAAC
jgi:hypothetical protein